MKFPAEEVAAMNRRLAEKREQRKLEAEIKQVIAMVQRRPFPEPVSEVQGEPVEVVDDRGEAWRSVVLAVMAFMMAGIWR